MKALANPEFDITNPKTYREMSTQKSPRMVPGLESNGEVSPIMRRMEEMTEVPSQTMATTGPEDKNLQMLS